MGSTAILASVKQIHELLKRYNRPQQAVTRELIDLYHDDAHGFDRFLASDEVWSKPGAIWQVTFYESEMHSPADARHDDLEFHSAIVRLVEAMVEAGIRHPKAESVAKTFCTWIRLHTRAASA